MIKINEKKHTYIKDIIIKNGFGLVDSIVGLTLLFGVITYGIYFSSLRLSTVYNSNLTNAINKEIERDIERLKSDFWGLFFEENNACNSQYCLANGDPLPVSVCSDFTQEIVNLDSWNLDKKTSNMMIQSWKPGSQRSKVFTGEPVIITRELIVTSPLDKEFLNKNIASISYSVQWPSNSKDIHWLSIYLSPEAHSWCNNLL
tara:strand:+ start:41 stop:646 length:606 start_codon:yes stop_codon:yes gene_type:complete